MNEEWEGEAGVQSKIWANLWRNVYVLCGFMMFLLWFIVYMGPEAGGLCHECCEMSLLIYDWINLMIMNTNGQSSQI